MFKWKFQSNTAVQLEQQHVSARGRLTRQSFFSAYIVTRARLRALGAPRPRGIPSHHPLSCVTGNLSEKLLSQSSNILVRRDYIRIIYIRLSDMSTFSSAESSFTSLVYNISASAHISDPARCVYYPTVIRSRRREEYFAVWGRELPRGSVYSARYSWSIGIQFPRCERCRCLDELSSPPVQCGMRCCVRACCVCIYIHMYTAELGISTFCADARVRASSYALTLLTILRCVGCGESNCARCLNEESD